MYAIGSLLVMYFLLLMRIKTFIGAIPFPVDHQNHNNYSIMNPSVGGGGYYGSYNSNSPR